MAYAYGDGYTSAEYLAAAKVFFPNGARHPSPGAAMQSMYQLNSMRLEHEINRARGLAFDSNQDEGFSHAHVESGQGPQGDQDQAADSPPADRERSAQECSDGVGTPRLLS